jgi:aminoglycoside phosphotransferase (APT) family kinase protein
LNRRGLIVPRPYETLSEADRLHPSDAVIARVRQRYPVDREIDAIYTRKMQRRHGPGYQPVTIERLVAGLESLIASSAKHTVTIDNARWLSGGASKLQMIFDLTRPDGSTTPMVLRMEPAASVTESSRRREFEVLQAVEGIIPAPIPFWVDGDAQHLPYPAMIYSFVTGSSKPSLDAEKVSGLGQNYGPELRARLAPQFVGLLGRLHTIDVAAVTGLEHFERPEVGSNASVIRQVNAARRIWEEDRVDEEPVMEIVYQWLIDNAPPLDHVSIVHGDYRSGNFLFDEERGEITAWLDWENATLGDRHQDLTYAANPLFEHLAEDGVTPIASGMMPQDELYEAYEAACGLQVDPARIVYFSLYNRYLTVALMLAASARASRGAGTHQDVLVNYVAGMGYLALAELRKSFMGVVA